MRLLFLHAFPLDNRMWSEQMQIMPGRTDAPNLYSLGTSIDEWAEGALTVAGDGPLIVVGSSMGGSCALEIARCAPKRVLALILLGSKAGHNPDPEYRDAMVDRLTNHGAKGIWSEIYQNLVGRNARPDIVARIKSLMVEQRNEDLIRAVRVFRSRPDASDVVEQWDKPLLAVCGDQDLVVTVAKTKTLVKKARFGSMYVMQGCGHYMNMEKPVEFRNVVSNFLRTVEVNTT